MKTVLLATSAVVALAGAAAAEVTVSGDARIGLRYENNPICIDVNDDGIIDALDDCRDSGWNVVNRARVKFTMTGETDSGLSFGAILRADQASAANNSRSTRTGEVWVKGSYGTLRAGDVDSALEAAVGDLPEVGLTGLNFYNETWYTQSDIDNYAYTNDAVLRYEYTFGNATVYASFQDQFIGYSTTERGKAWSLGAGYELGNYTFGGGYEKSEYTNLPIAYDQFGRVGVFFPNDSATFAISGGTSISGITVKGIFSQTNVDGLAGTPIVDDLKYTQFGIGADYKMANGIGVSGFWKRTKYDENLDLFGLGPVDYDVDYYGLGARYDLGGGAVVKGGIAHANYKNADIDDNTVADFGIALTF